MSRVAAALVAAVAMGAGFGCSGSTPKTITVSVPWSTADFMPGGVTVTVHHVDTCEGSARLAIAETTAEVVIRVLTDEPSGVHGCMAIRVGTPAVTTGRLSRPLVGRMLVHGKVTGEG
jgi:hypothetical protein